MLWIPHEKAEFWEPIDKQIRYLNSCVSNVTMTYDYRENGNAWKLKREKDGVFIIPEELIVAAGGNLSELEELLECDARKAAVHVNNLSMLWKAAKTDVPIPVYEEVRLDKEEYISEIGKIRDEQCIPIKFECVKSGVPVEDVI